MQLGLICRVYWGYSPEKNYHDNGKSTMNEDECIFLSKIGIFQYYLSFYRVLYHIHTTKKNVPLTLLASS